MSNSNSDSSPLSRNSEKNRIEEKERVRVNKKTLQAMLQECQRALESLNNGFDEDDDDDGAAMSEEESICKRSLSQAADQDTDELCHLLKSRAECADFLEKLESAQVLGPPNNSEEGSSWDMVSDNDLWESENIDLDQEDYVLVREEDIADGIACFMAAYLLSIKQTKNVTPNQLQEALSKMFSGKKRKGKLRKALDGTKVIYNLASWGATAVGLYQNPVILRVASKAFWTSCDVISKIL